MAMVVDGRLTADGVWELAAACFPRRRFTGWMVFLIPTN